MRDPSALLLLFVMPLAMVFIVTLIQKAAFDQMGSLHMRLLIVDCDRDTLGPVLYEKFRQMDGMTVALTRPESCPSGASEIKPLAYAGKWQTVLLLKHGTSEAIRQTAYYKAAQFMNTPADTTAHKADSGLSAQVFFDPEVTGLMRLLLFQNIDRITQALGAGFLVGEMSRVLGLDMGQFSLASAPLRLEEIEPDNTAHPLDAVTHNIPSWTVFALFFIVVPMATGIVRERDTGLRRRLTTLPPPVWLYDLGRVTMYMLVCLLQAALIFAAGWWFFPILELGNLSFRLNLPVLGLSLVIVAFAATAFGQAVGSLARSHEQAAAFGSLSVVILAALGGLWVPHFVMPPALQTVSTWSPLHWALQSLYEVVLRDGSWSALKTSWLRLTFFGVGMLLLASGQPVLKRLMERRFETRSLPVSF
jgi:ABC-2 type transport system permease protein